MQGVRNEPSSDVASFTTKMKLNYEEYHMGDPRSKTELLIIGFKIELRANDDLRLSSGKDKGFENL